MNALNESAAALAGAAAGKNKQLYDGTAKHAPTAPDAQAGCNALPQFSYLARFATWAVWTGYAPSERLTELVLADVAKATP